MKIGMGLGRIWGLSQSWRLGGVVGVVVADPGLRPRAGGVKIDRNRKGLRNQGQDSLWEGLSG